MSRTPFNRDWFVQPNVSIFQQLNDDPDNRTRVTLPHDAMITMPRSADAPGGAGAGYFTGGAVQYSKSFPVPLEWRDKRVSVEFQGVYRDAMVYVNGVFADHRAYGYSTFRVALDPFLKYGEGNTIRVEARAHNDSRWYSGLGIHRDTALIVTELAHVAADGVRVTTPDVDPERAVLAVSTAVVNESTSTRLLSLTSRVVDAGGTEVTAVTSPITLRAGATGVTRQRAYIQRPSLWSVEQPTLYRVVTELREDATLLETREATVGIRTLQLDPLHGLRINGEVVKLRGANVHHDNGILGAATIARAEERRVEILKGTGFNAIRSAHNPMSDAMLHACDRLGMLVMDEAFDMWAIGKNNFDYSTVFPEWWERDIEAMVTRDYNHPSVILYSIGNEVLDTGSPLGASLGRTLAEKVRSIDDTRFVTCGVSGFVSTITELIGAFKQQVGELKATGNVNDLMHEMHDLMSEISLSETVTRKTAEIHSVVDVVAHNYSDERYVGDQAMFPDRVLVGSETLPKRIDIIWDLVQQHPHVIGDFTWAGWDYLGEAGIGLPRYEDENGEEPPFAPFPSLLAWAADIDITGYRRPASYYREIVFGLRDEPFIAVERPGRHGKKSFALDWAWTDSTSSWSWSIDAGSPVSLEVYSASEEVELFLNGRSQGIRPSGPAHRYRSRFDLGFVPGELVAVARSSGREVARTTLRTAEGTPRLVVRADRTDLRADDTDLAFVTIELADHQGVLFVDRDVEVRVTVTGAGVLQGLGSARPETTERFDTPTQTTFEGRALAAIRPSGTGEIIVTAESSGLDGAWARLESR